METPSLPDPRNADIMIYINGELLPRDQAKISVFDSLVQGGDGAASQGSATNHQSRAPQSQVEPG